MKTLEDQLAQYAAYHRDRRNIATHFVGIPLIVLAVCVLLARPAWGGGWLSPATWVSLAATVFYMRLDVKLGLLMGALLAGCVALAVPVAAWPTGEWLMWGVGAFVAGWAIQFVGHIFEGRKPAFVDDVVGLLIGPLFIVVEALFALGWRPALRQAVEARTGATRNGRVGASVAGA